MTSYLHKSDQYNEVNNGAKLIILDDFELLYSRDPPRLAVPNEARGFYHCRLHHSIGEIMSCRNSSVASN